MRIVANPGGRRFQFVGIAYNTTPFINVYPVTSGSTLGGKLGNPGTLPTGICNSVRWSNDNSNIAVGMDTTPYVQVYPWTRTATGGWGTKYADPSTLPTGSVEHTDWNPTRTTIACGHFTSPYFSFYQWDDSSGFGTKYADPTATGITVGLDVQFSPDGTVVVIGGTAASGYAYPWDDSSGFGTKYADPTGMPGAVHGLDWKSTGDYIVVGESLTPFIQIFPWSNSTGWGTVLADPGTIPTSTCFMAKWSDRSFASGTPNTIIYATDNSPYVNSYTWTGSAWGTKSGNPVTLPTGTGTGASFNAANNLMSFSSTLSPFLFVYLVNSAGTIGNKFTNPGTLPGGSALDVEFTF
jgi:hypothetical protein